MARGAIALTKKEAAELGITGERPKRRRSVRRTRKPTLRGDLSWWRRHAIINGESSWALWLMIPTPPRPKKNSTKVIWIHGKPKQVQSDAYCQFVVDVRTAIEPCAKRIGLPLPEGKYHICPQFYCDNDKSDLKNLEQGLADALEKAGVVTNDQMFEAWEGSRRHVDKARPRVEITIRPLVE